MKRLLAPLLLLPLIACQGEKADDGASLEANAAKNYPIAVSTTLDGYNNLSSCIGPIQIIRKGFDLPEEVPVLISSNAVYIYEDSECVKPIESFERRGNYHRLVVKKSEDYKKEIYVAQLPKERTASESYTLQQEILISAAQESDESIDSNEFALKATEGLLPSIVTKVTPVGLKNLRALVAHPQSIKSIHWILYAKINVPGYGTEDYFSVASGDIDGSSSQYNLNLGDFSFASTTQRSLALSTNIEVDGISYYVESPAYEF